ncbi:MAG: glycosyltransferase, partial [Saprospiraceae bacterium]|nr:glycosyltransferase [Saprospiraceae bacterium]
MMTEKKVAILILNYNGIDYLTKFVPTLIKFTPNFCELIVADNASTDNSVAFLKSNYPDIKIIQLSENHGFADGYNRAIDFINHEYTLLLNSDIEVTENWITPLYEMITKDDNIGAVQPVVLS